eukprot:GHVQ01023324.1.p1 GENE.GHVQ01023324.1~~GHVQ01023324.1.p1  ORF type:complete len:145 (+),score=18.23 GHVQ01023324.1:262-696(+)
MTCPILVVAILVLMLEVPGGSGEHVTVPASRFAQQMSELRSSIEVQTQALDLAADKQDDVYQRLHEIELFLTEARLEAQQDKKHCTELMREIEYLDRTGMQILAAMSNREDQLKYRIRMKHISDPYVESFSHNVCRPMTRSRCD